MFTASLHDSNNNHVGTAKLTAAVPIVEWRGCIYIRMSEPSTTQTGVYNEYPVVIVQDKDVTLPPHLAIRRRSATEPKGGRKGLYNRTIGE